MRSSCLELFTDLAFWKQQTVFCRFTELLQALFTLPAAEPLTQEILQLGGHALNAFHRGEQREIVGAVLYGRPQVHLFVLPAAAPAKPRGRPRRFTGQLDLFAAEG